MSNRANGSWKIALIASGMLCAMEAGAQETPSTAPSTMPSTMPTTAPSSRATTGNNHGVTTQPGGAIMLNFKDANIDAVLDELSAAAGFIVVKEVQRVEGRVTQVSKQPVKPD